MKELFDAITSIDLRLKSIETSLSSKGKTKGLIEQDLLNIKEASAYLRISENALYLRVHKKNIPHFKDGSRVLFSRKQIDSYLWSNEVKTIAEEVDNILSKE